MVSSELVGEVPSVKLRSEGKYLWRGWVPMWRRWYPTMPPVQMLKARHTLLINNLLFVPFVQPSGGRTGLG